MAMNKIIILFLFTGFFNSEAISQQTNDTSIGIRLSSFNISKQNNQVNLNWKVICRLSYARFEVQSSIDGINFTNIDSFQADYLRCQQPFNYIVPTIAGQVFYRIKVGDLDGRFSAEKVIKVTGRDITESEIKIISPVISNFLQLIVVTNNYEKISLQLLNMSGILLQNFSINPPKGVSQIDVPLTNLQTGMFILMYQTSGQKKSILFMKSN